MELLGDNGQMEACFGPFVDSVNLDTRKVHGLRRTYHRLRNHFGRHQMELLGDKGQTEACFGLFGDSVNLNTRKVHDLR